MNHYTIVIKRWYDLTNANEGVNNFIKKCNENGVEILDITSHVTEEEGLTYVFIFKLKTVETANEIGILDISF